MSGSVSPGPGAPFTNAEVVAIRRYCGYPPPRGGPDPVAAALAGLDADYVDVVRTTFLAVLPLLEADIDAMRSKVGTAIAAVWTRNPPEAAEREASFRTKRLRLCYTIGIESGPLLSTLIPAAFVV